MNGESALDRKIVGLAMQSQRDLRDLQAARVRYEHFTDPTSAEVWKIIQKLDEAGEHIDPVVVLRSTHYADEKLRRNITGDWLTGCVTSAPYGHPGETYAKQLKDQYDRHRTVLAITRAQQMLTGNASVQEVRLEMLNALQGVGEQSLQLTSAADAATKALETFDGVTHYTPTPWKNLNTIIRGWRPGGLYIIGARPGVGKSLLMQNAALPLAETGPVLFMTTEMEADEVATRHLSMMTGIDQAKMVGRRSDGTSPLSPSDWDRLRAAQQKYAQLKIQYDTSSVVPIDIRENARAIAAKEPLAAIFVDYLQLLSSPGRVENRTQELTKFTRQLKRMAMEFQCPVIVASQLNRNAANEKRPPVANELRDSGSIEQDADVIILLHSDPEADETQNLHKQWSGKELDAIVDKNRQGRRAYAPLRSFGNTATITDDNPRPQIGKGKDQ